MMVAPIELKAEYVMTAWGVLVTNTFLTTVLVTLIVGALGVAFYFLRNHPQSKIFNGVRVVVYELLKLTDMVTQNRALSMQILPLVSTFFLFIFTANLLALVPGFLGSLYIQTPEGALPLLRSPNSDLTTTLALAIFSVTAIQIFSMRALGITRYILRFINLGGPIKFILGFFEMISECVKVLSFSFRLFGNVFAGEVLLLVIAFLVPFIIPLPFMILEVFVGIIQAFIFAVLTLTFIKTSTIRHIAHAPAMRHDAM